MSSSNVKIEKSKLLQKYKYIKTHPYIIEKKKILTKENSREFLDC